MRSILVVVALAFAVSCHASPEVPTPVERTPPVASAPPSALASAEIRREELGPAQVERVNVAKDSPASVVRAAHGSTARVVFMPGLCSNAYAYVLAFPEAARSHGGVVAIDGDQPCGEPDSGFHSFTWSATIQRSRIDAALAAAVARAPHYGFTLAGYSAGASIAQMRQ